MEDCLSQTSENDSILSSLPPPLTERDEVEEILKVRRLSLRSVSRTATPCPAVSTHLIVFCSAFVQGYAADSCMALFSRGTFNNKWSLCHIRRLRIFAAPRIPKLSKSLRYIFPNHQDGRHCPTKQRPICIEGFKYLCFNIGYGGEFRMAVSLGAFLGTLRCHSTE